MNTPFKGQIDWLPDFIGEELMKQQEYQGNKRDISVFEENVSSDKNDGGFEWKETSQKYNFWDRVLLDKDINLFLAWFKPELEVWDNNEKLAIKTKVTSYAINETYKYKTTLMDTMSHCFKHARLPKKENAEKLELLKKADELLTKAAELKAAAEKL